MVKEVTIKNIKQIQQVVAMASTCADDIGVHDAEGKIADAKSILGMLALDLSAPVKLVSEDSELIEKVSSALEQ